MNKVKFPTMALVAVRSLFLEASWNPMWQQNLGLAAAIDPALKVIYGPGEGLKAARMRALGFFNTNPIASGVAIGAAIRLEEEVALGRLGPAEKERMLSGLSVNALAPMGDDLFWFSWLPLCSLVGVWAVLSQGLWWGPLLLPLIFCLAALPVRFIGLWLGYRLGDEVTDLLLDSNLSQLARNIKRVVAVMIGASTVILLFTKGGLPTMGPLGLWLITALVAAWVMFLRFMSARARILRHWYPAVLVLAATFGVAVWEIVSRP